MARAAYRTAPSRGPYSTAKPSSPYPATVRFMVPNKQAQTPSALAQELDRAYGQGNYAVDIEQNDYVITLARNSRLSPSLKALARQFPR
ncbi:hypothetical protein B0H67DRAFT_569184 [Lasiosphaeris hirsuta]|uniref:Uncharacterized protein n=1 Tax=Lasiosphaeris hirsuta TaxID=260670 RepID=A0AA40E2S9_9PEZI|nr:hypothetical protein B0H67DRAFT_569184 [Lasiosphaeris hirsuta]